MSIHRRVTKPGLGEVQTSSRVETGRGVQTSFPKRKRKTIPIGANPTSAEAIAISYPTPSVPLIIESSPPESLICPTSASSVASSVPPSGRSRKRSRPAIAIDDVGSIATALAAKIITPRLARGRSDLTNAPIGNRDAFLLSFVDGQLNIEELADVAGMPRSEVSDTLQRLARLGFIFLS